MHFACYICRIEYKTDEPKPKDGLPIHFDFCATCQKKWLEEFEKQFRRRLRLEGAK